jgi:hypothetical protein
MSKRKHDATTAPVAAAVEEEESSTDYWDCVRDPIANTFLQLVTCGEKEGKFTCTHDEFVDQVWVRAAQEAAAGPKRHALRKRLCKVLDIRETRTTGTPELDLSRAKLQEALGKLRLASKQVEEALDEIFAALKE